VAWSCDACGVKLRKRCRLHGPCGSMTTWTCLVTERKGRYDHYKRHALHCEFCSPDRDVDIHEEKEANKENRMQAVEDEEKESSSWPWNEWSKNDFSMRVMTGLTLKMMNWVYDKCREGLLSLRLTMHHNHENVAPMSPHNLLCITVYWLRRYPPFEEMVITFHRSESYLHHMVKSVVGIMESHIFKELIYPVDNTSPYSTRSTLPKVRLIVDSTFIALPKEPRHPFLFHPKSPTKSALKVQISCDLSHRIVDVSDVVYGSVHDMTLLRQSGFLKQSNVDTRIIGDIGYKGKLGIIHPASRKRKPNRELLMLEDESTKSHELESERAAVEQINSRFKVWRIVGTVYRGEWSDEALINSVVRTVCALSNLVMKDDPVRWDVSTNRPRHS